MTKKILIYLSLFCAAAVTLLLFFMIPEQHGSEPSSNSEVSLISQETDPLLLGEYWVKDLRLTQKKDGRVSTLSANLLVQRKRITRFFVYHNMRELFLQNLTVESLHRNTSRETFLAPLQDVVPALSSLEADDPRARQSNDGTSEGIRESEKQQKREDTGIEQDISNEPINTVVRIIARPVNIRVQKGRCLFTMDANRLRVELKNQFAALEDNVSIKLSSGEHYSPSRVIIAPLQDGVFVEESLGVYRKHMISANCNLQRTDHVEKLDATDALEEQERLMLEKLGPKMPLHLQLLLGVGNSRSKQEK